MGKRKKYETVEELEAAIAKYFDDCDVGEKPYGFAGLAYSLGFAERRSLNDYAKRDDELSTPIKKAMLKIEAQYEQRLNTGTPTGAIFALKNRGWSDKQVIEHGGKVELPVRVSVHSLRKKREPNKDE
jgi:hypothetical protein